MRGFMTHEGFQDFLKKNPITKQLTENVTWENIAGVSIMQ